MTPKQRAMGVCPSVKDDRYHRDGQLCGYCRPIERVITEAVEEERLKQMAPMDCGHPFACFSPCGAADNLPKPPDSLPDCLECRAILEERQKWQRDRARLKAALFRPCLDCGYEPRKITLTNGSVVEEQNAQAIEARGEEDVNDTEKLDEIKRQHGWLDNTNHMDARLGYCAKCWLISEIESLRQQLAERDAVICGMRKARELLNNIKDDQSLEWTRAIDILDEALSSSPTCPHKEEVAKLKEELVVGEAGGRLLKAVQEETEAQLGQARRELGELKSRARLLIDAIPPMPNIDLQASINQMLETLAHKE